MSISTIINTRNEEPNIARAIKSVKKFSDEIIVVDMESTDNTVKIAKDHGAKVFSHKNVGYVEPARNFAISKASSDWILILDADEEISASLFPKLQELSSKADISYVRIPRQNIIFEKWIAHARWWPDYNIRFFKKGAVIWDDAIHSIPMTTGQGIDLPEDQQFAIKHYHYQSISQFITRLDRYTNHQLKILENNRYEFHWYDLITKPTNEFLSRYFAHEGYKDGVHGLAVCLLQAFSELVLYLKAWESQDFPKTEIMPDDLSSILNKNSHDFSWWMAKLPFVKKTNAIFWKIKSKL